MRALLVLSLLAGACYQLDTSPGRFRCDAPGDTCPATLRCIAGVCSAATDESAPRADAAPAPMIDAGAASAACAGAGLPLWQEGAAEVHACTGRFARGAAASLCRGGYRPCGAEDEALLGAAVRAGRCDGLAGFYAAQIDAALRADGGALLCQQAAPGRPALVGCGRELSTSDAVAVTVLAGACRQLPVALPCDASPSAWQCTTRLADAAHADDARGGVLCCKAQ